MVNPKVPALLDSGSMKTAGNGAHSVTLSGDLLKDWRAQREAMRQIALAMPEIDFRFKPTPPQRSFGDQLLHVAGVNVQLVQCLGGQATVVSIPDAPGGKRETVAALDDSYAYGVSVISGLTNVALLQSVSGPVWFGQATRARVIAAALSHGQNVYGQLAVYLRLKGIIPPASRGDAVY